MKSKKIILAVAVISLALFGCSANKEETKVDTTSNAPSGPQAIVKTARGEFSIALDSEAAPKTIENFINKSKDGFYKDKIFHRVENWVVQGGDPAGNGTGGGDQATELSKRNFAEGSVGIARGQDIKVSNDSQFFICTEDCSFLNNQYTYFGKVISGMDIVKKIQIGDKIEGIEIK